MLALVACSSGDDASPNEGSSTVMGPGMTGNDNQPASDGPCAMGTAMLCTCMDGNNGTATCQVDGTFSVCQCGANGAPTAGNGVVMGGAGTMAMVPPVGQAGTGMTNQGGGPAPADQIVNVPPEDVAACDGAGTPPSTDEVVEVLEVRTDKVMYNGAEVPVVPGGFTAPGGTYYACFWVELDMPDKHHIIGWKGAVGGDRAIHHQQVSLSKKPFYLPAQGGLCGLPTVDFTWTGERDTEWTPGLVGYPIGGPENGGKAHFLWQTHFEGATTYTGGFDAYITKNLRKYDGGNFEQGDVAGISIPPMGQETHVATCTPEMTREKLVHPIYVYRSMLHAHLTVQHIKGELFRDEMHTFTFGDQMVAGGFLGFFDQSFMPHTPCVAIMPGDKIVTTCEYNNPFNFEVTGGEATNQEMCTTFMQYFPRLPGTSNNFCGTIDSTGGFMP